MKSKQFQFRAALAVAAAFLFMFPRAASAQNHRLGVGAHYWVTVDKIDVEDVDESGVAWLVSYQYLLSSIFTVEADLEVFTGNFGGSKDTVFAPQAFLLLGSTIYGGLGGGFFTAGESFSADPFFTLRAGLDFEIIRGLFLDINASYTFTDFDDISDALEEINTDTVTLGAAVRFGF